MIVMFNGQPVNVSERSDGTVGADTLRQAGDIPDNRQLIVKQPDGSNLLVSRTGGVELAEGAHIDHAGIHERGVA